MFSICSGYSQFIDVFIRPPRHHYLMSELGPSQFQLRGKSIKRTDFSLINKRNLSLECSLYQPTDQNIENQLCIIYLHGNSGSRLEGLPLVENFLQEDICILLFDFSGSGKSEGQYVTLGYYESQDIDIVLSYLRHTLRLRNIALWGRSMGAVSAILHAERDPQIWCLFLDSPFSNLNDLSVELGKNMTGLPGFLVKGGLKLIRSTLKDKVGVDILKIRPSESVNKIYIPALFTVGKSDTLIAPQHVTKLYQHYAGINKKFIWVDGGHNDLREPSFYQSALEFINSIKKEKFQENLKIINSPPFLQIHQTFRPKSHTLQSDNKYKDNMYQQHLKNHKFQQEIKQFEEQNQDVNCNNYKEKQVSNGFLTKSTVQPEFTQGDQYNIRRSLQINSQYFNHPTLNYNQQQNDKSYKENRIFKNSQQ